MKLRILSRFLRHVRRSPSRMIEGDYLHRWHLLPKNRWMNLYLHRFGRSDPKDAFHDHPWWNVSLVLRGRYVEHTPDRSPRLRRGGSLVLRSAYACHRIDVAQGPVWTLFLTGPKRKTWGFSA